MIDPVGRMVISYLRMTRHIYRQPDNLLLPLNQIVIYFSLLPSLIIEVTTYLLIIIPSFFKKKFSI